MKLKDLPSGIKVSFLWLYAFTILGFLFAFIIVDQTVSHSPLSGFLHRLMDYYKGNPSEMKFGKSVLELAEVSHFHSFISPLIAFVFSVFFSYSNTSQKLKSAIINLTFIGLLGFILSPWLIKFFPFWIVYIKPLSTLLFLPGILIMGAKVLIDMFL